MVIVQVRNRFTVTFDDVDTALVYATMWQRQFGWGEVHMG